jgi:CRP/FNR family cyclic AMP-dependent transcriptional regulator
MDATQLAQALQESAFAAVFPTDTALSLVERARWRSCPAGTILFREGERCDSFYVVHRGHVALDMRLPTQGCTRLLTLGPGEVVAWSALVGDGRMTATAVTADVAELIELSGEEVLKQCEADPQLGYRVMRRLAAALAKRLLATRLQMLDLFSADAAAHGEKA